MTYFKRLYSAQAIKHNNKSGMMVVKQLIKANGMPMPF